MALALVVAGREGGCDTLVAPDLALARLVPAPSLRAWVCGMRVVCPCAHIHDVWGVWAPVGWITSLLSRPL